MAGDLSNDAITLIVSFFVVYGSISLGVVIGLFARSRRIQQDGRVVYEFEWVPDVLKRELWLRPLYVLAVFLPALLWPLVLVWKILHVLFDAFCSCSGPTTCCGRRVYPREHGHPSPEVDVEAVVVTQSSPTLTPGSSDDEKTRGGL